MNGEERRKEILKFIGQSPKPVSGTELAKQFDVSRQVIVQDVALLRAQNQDILSTHRGYVLQTPEEEKFLLSKNEILARLVVCMGGRAAEEVVFDSITTGASNDIKRATETARSMVMKYGMSEKIGLIAYGNDDDEVFIGRDLAHTRGYSEEVAREIDGEISRIIRECHENAESIIRENIGVLHSCAALLLEKEKIHREEFEALFTTEKEEVAKTNE